MISSLLNKSNVTASVVKPVLQKVVNVVAIRGYRISLVTLNRDGDNYRGGSRSFKNYNNNNNNRNNYTSRGNSGYYGGNYNNYNGRNNNRYGKNDKFGRNNKGFMEKHEEDGLKGSKFTKVVVVPKEEDETVLTFEELYKDKILNDDLYEAIKRFDFPNLTPVQQKTIKPIVENDKVDVITRAKTGTGKTFAFLLPIMEHLLRNRKDAEDAVKSVIIAPTRDLALQIEQEIRKLYANNKNLRKFSCISLVGGTNYTQAIKNMKYRRPNIVIATPGRLIQTLDEFGSKFFQNVDFKVLDEADRLLEIGFKTDLEYISSTLNKLNTVGPEHIRTLLFSATLDDKVQVLANDIMNKEECLFLDTVDKDAPEAHEKIDQSAMISKTYAQSIFATIDHIKCKVNETPEYKAILFTPTVKFTSFICNLLQNEFGRSFPILEFHGKISQNRRTYLVRDFKKMNSGLLVCTDVGARGMDFPNVGEVLQLGVPTELANYVHRIGRTARAGNDGASVLFICKDELPFLHTLRSEKKIEIANSKNYEPTQAIIDSVTKNVRSERELKDVVMTLLSSYQACADAYRFNPSRIFPNITSTYGELLNEPDKKVPIESLGMLSKFGFGRARYANDMFELDTSDNFSKRDDESDHSNSRSRYGGRNSYNNRGSQNRSNGNWSNTRSYGGNRSGNSERFNPRFD